MSMNVVIHALWFKLAKKKKFESSLIEYYNASHPRSIRILNHCLCYRRPVPNIPPRIPDRPYYGRLNWASPWKAHDTCAHPTPESIRRKSFVCETSRWPGTRAQHETRKWWKTMWWLLTRRIDWFERWWVTVRENPGFRERIFRGAQDAPRPILFSLSLSLCLEIFALL